MKRGKNISLELKDMIILMNRLERLSPKRISEKLNVSINTVKTIVRKSNKADRNGETPKLRVRRLTEPMNTEVLIKRLRMENQLLRDFLQLTGRKRERRLSITLSISSGRNIGLLLCVVSLAYLEVATMTLSSV